MPAGLVTPVRAAPTGAATGDLTGTYPAPTLASGVRITAGQAAIANLSLGTLTLLTDAITAIGTIQTKVNTLLAELRTSVLLP
jgi:uncharacterized protein YpuA (DUF1002 family)